MELTVNGRPRELPAGASVADLLALLGQDSAGRGLAVAVNGEVVARGGWASTNLSEGDRVEVLGAAQGG